MTAIRRLQPLATNINPADALRAPPQIPFARIFADPDHSKAEEREVIVGYNSANVLLAISFTERDGNIHFIGARRAIIKERHAHETYLD